MLISQEWLINIRERFYLKGDGIVRPLKILLILIEPPLPFGNPASRWFHVLLGELKKRGHSVDILVASGVETDIEKSKKIFANENFYIFPFYNGHSFVDKIKTLIFPQKFLFSSDFLKKMDELNPNKYDILHIEQTWAGWTGLRYAHKSVINVHHLQTIDLEFVTAPNWKQKIAYKTWFRTEKFLLSKYPFVRSCSPRLVPYIEKWGKKKCVEVVPVGMDPSLYTFIDRKKRRFEKPNITIIGNMGWYPSFSAAERLLQHIWPQVKEKIPNAELRIIGWNARQALSKYLNGKDVYIYENVPDIQPYFEQATVMVYAPSRGSGMKIKILESLLFGVPVVTTDEGAEGLPAQDMVHLGLANDNLGLIERTLQILSDENLQEALRVQGRKLVESHCSGQKTVDQMESMYQKIIDSQSTN